MVMDFIQNSMAQAKAVDDGGGVLIGVHMDMLRIDAAGDGGAVPFYFGVCPDYYAIQSGNLNTGVPFFTAEVYTRPCGTTSAFFAPTTAFPGPDGRGVASIVGDPFAEHLDSIPMGDRTLRFTANTSLNEAQKEYRKGLQCTARTLMQVVLLDRNANPVLDAAGEPQVFLWWLARRDFKQNAWETYFVNLANAGISVVDIRNGVGISGQRTGKGQFDTRYTCLGPMFHGPYPICRDASGAVDEAMVQKVLSKVRPWEQVMEVGDVETMQKLLAGWKQARFAHAFPQLAGTPYAPQQAPYQPAPQPAPQQAPMPPQQAPHYQQAPQQAPMPPQQAPQQAPMPPQQAPQQAPMPPQQMPGPPSPSGSMLGGPPGAPGMAPGQTPPVAPGSPSSPPLS